MNAEVLRPEKTGTTSAEMINAVLALASRTNTPGIPAKVAKPPRYAYEVLMQSLIEEYDKKL